MTNSKNKSLLLERYKSHPVAFFLVLFAAQMILFYLLYYSPRVIEWVISPLVNRYAILSSWLLNRLGQQTIPFGDVLSSPQFSVVIKKGCDALEPMALFFSGLMAFPSSLKKKFYGLLFGLAILFLLNIIRITSLFFIGEKFPDLFEIMHMKVWQVVFIITAIAMWYLWLQWTLPKTKST